MSDDDEDASSRRGPLIAMAVIVVLAVGGYFLFGALRGANRTQDCVMSGRTNCAPVQP